MLICASPGSGALRAVQQQGAKHTPFPELRGCRTARALGGGGAAPHGAAAPPQQRRRRPAVAGGGASARRTPPPPRASASAAAAPAPAPAPAPPPRRWLGWLPSRESRDLLASCWRLLAANLAAVVVIHAVKEGVVFFLHRATQRATNAAAEGALGVVLPPFVNPWYLFMEPKFVEVNWGYQVVVALFFLLSLPLNIFFNSAASASVAMVCVGQQQKEPQPKKGGSSGGSGGATGGASSGGNGSSGSPSAAEAGSGGGAAAEAAAGAASAAGTGAAVSSAEAAAPAASGEPSGGAGRAGTGSERSSGSGSSSAGAGAGAVAPATVAGEGTLWGATFSGGPSPSAGRQGSATFRPQPHRPPPPPPPSPGPLAALRAGLADARRGWSAAAPSLRRVWAADLAFNAWSLPLQAVSLLVLPVFWAFPRLLSIQLAVPAAILAGTGPAASLARSRELMAGRAAAYAWPYLLLTLASRGVDAAKQALLIVMPERYWHEVIEVPIVVTLGFTVAKVLVMRMQDLLPLAMYLRLAAGGGVAGGGGAAAAERKDA
ncbi:hypothetical protein Rsub_04797 [Raphidocelis subcapitata]|uniref:Uncharacterized protein n=1 Tax=Raphidocelis subcapitata TaxID=307507 RepID=A0A2V0NTY5_9CHLO|nr:hypothetical protein Rsub_04797 [Raphidocelis subcapitata]|eukprot:GBF91128.1 hypothetical protein Rsub_04797 [Raphidocelis subcapitata]